MKSSQQFLGLIKFYRWFLPAIAGVVQTLTDAFRGCPRRLVWSPSIAVRFTAAKPQLFLWLMPRPHAVLAVVVDDSDTHTLGVVLEQLQLSATSILPSQVVSHTGQLLHLWRALLAAFNGTQTI
jgi:hypothetical protein